jgi:hypothetical protein
LAHRKNKPKPRRNIAQPTGVKTQLRTLDCVTSSELINLSVAQFV